MIDLRHSTCKYGQTVRREWDKFKELNAPLFDDIELPPVRWNSRITRSYGRTTRVNGFNTRIDLTTRFKHPRVPMKRFKHTLNHEFIHLLVYNHGIEFRRIARPMGITRFNPHTLPRAKPRRRRSGYIRLM